MSVQDKILELISPTNKDNVLFFGTNALENTLKFAHLLKERKLKCSLSVISDENLDAFLVKNKEYSSLIPNITISTFETFSAFKKINKIVLFEENYSSLQKDFSFLQKFSNVVFCGIFPIFFSEPVEVIRKSLLKEVKEYFSFKELWKKAGLEFSFYDVFEDRLFCCGTFKNFSKIEFSKAKFEDFCEKLFTSLEPYIKGVREGVSFGTFDDTKEYLLYITIEPLRNSPPIFDFICFSDFYKISRGPSYPYSKKFTILIIPNTPTFVHEIETKGSLILEKEKIFAFFR
ncbi:MAG: hypothetical protein QW735_03985 [archaeon]